jgi:cysteine desulfurase/selenocysteine lyase
MSKPVSSARQDFPILKVEVNGYPLVYLDNGATTQKPQVVIDAISNYYSSYNSNVHRGNHTLSLQATAAHEAARKKVQAFINAASEQEVIFTRGTTESINLVAFSFGEGFVNPGDDIIVTQMEHHSNFVPWQLMCQRRGAHFRVAPIDMNGELDLAAFKAMLSERTKLVALTHVSNALGTVNPLETIIPLAHAVGAAVLVDGAQAVQHIAHDVQAMDADFYAFSGHKMYAPTGIGVLYGKKNWLEKMPPYQSGGEMIDRVTMERTTFNTLPFKFEAGTPNIEGPIGLAAAIDYLAQFNQADLQAHEEDLLDYGLERLGNVPGMTIYGSPKRRSSILSFNVAGIQHYDMGTLLDLYGIAVRTGHHCAQPLMDRLGVMGTVRASLGIYNMQKDIDALVDGIMQVKKRLGK